MELLCESLERFSSEKCELIFIENTEDDYRDTDMWRRIANRFSQIHELHGVHIHRNIGHGAGLNLGTYLSQSPYTMFLDVDCHILQRGWEEAFISKMNEFDVVAGRGVPQKPIRPACMFMKTDVAKKYDWRDTPNYKGHRITPEGFDVAIKAYKSMVDDGVKISLIDSHPSRYNTISGEEWCIDDIPYVYHHWHGAHLQERQIDFPDQDLQENKASLFRQIPWRLADESL